jgi:hypothetical protein
VLRLYVCSSCIILFCRGLAHHSNELLIMAFFANFLERRKAEVRRTSIPRTPLNTVEARGKARAKRRPRCGEDMAVQRGQRNHRTTHTRREHPPHGTSSTTRAKSKGQDTRRIPGPVGVKNPVGTEGGCPDRIMDHRT